MTLRKAIGLNKVSRATAWDGLAELVEQAAIKPFGEGHSRSYRFPLQSEPNGDPIALDPGCDAPCRFLRSGRCRSGFEYR